eukprot:5124969-Pyramimonas_sp.AAC.1
MSSQCTLSPATSREDLDAFRNLTLEYYDGLGVNLDFQVNQCPLQLTISGVSRIRAFIRNNCTRLFIGQYSSGRRPSQTSSDDSAWTGRPSSKPPTYKSR